MIDLIFESIDKPKYMQTLPLRSLAIAGWTGRDANSVNKHIAELAELGVAPPVRTPLIYRAAGSLLTIQPSIEVIGKRTSGEAEFILFSHEADIWVGIGSDHTCRELEMTSVPASKQACAKPIGPIVWRLRDLQPHWDELELRSYILHDGMKKCYQNSKVEHIHTPSTLMDLCLQEDIDLEASILFSGTVPLVMPWASSDQFICELHDPILNRSIQCTYSVRCL